MAYEDDVARIRALREQQASPAPATKPLTGDAARIAELRAKMPPPTQPQPESGNDGFEGLWGGHLLRGAASFGGDLDGPPVDAGGEFEAARATAATAEDAALRKYATRNKVSVRQARQRLLARDVTTVGGLLLGGPALPEGVGVGGAILGAAGRIGIGATLGGALGAAEGALGGRSSEETLDMAKQYAAGGALVSTGLEALGGLAKLGGRYVQLSRLFKELHLKPIPVEEHAAGLAANRTANEVIQKSVENKAAIEVAKKEVSDATRHARKFVRPLGPKDLDEPTRRAWAIQELKKKGIEIDPEAAAQEIFDQLRDQKVARPGLPRDSRRRLKAPLNDEVASAARRVFRAHLGNPDGRTGMYLPERIAAATKHARRVAAKIKKQELEELMDVGRVANEADALRVAVLGGYDADRNYFGGVLNTIWNVQKHGINRVADLLKTTKIFGSAGPAVGELIHTHMQLADALIGHNSRIVRSILKPLTYAERIDLDSYLRWHQPTENPKVIAAAKQWTDFYGFMADETKRLGIYTKDRGLTQLYSNMKEPEQKALHTYLRVFKKYGEWADEVHPKVQEAFDALSPDAKRLLEHMNRLDADLERAGGWHVVRPFQESKIKAPDYYDPKFLQELADNPEHPLFQRFVDDIMHNRPELVNPVTGEPYDVRAIYAEVRSMLSNGNGHAPKDIQNNSLQWSREALIPADYRISDPAVWMEKYTHEASMRHAAAHSYGGRNQKFNAIAEVAANEMHESLGNKFLPSNVMTHSEQVLHDVFDLAMGGGQQTNTWIKAGNSFATMFRLGFRTAVKQIPALAQSAGSHGIANTLDALRMTLSSREARVYADDIGATVQDLEHAIGGDQLTDSAQKFVRGTGIVLADRLTRRTSAIAAMLRARAAARALSGLSKSGAARMEAEQALRWFQRLNVDVEPIIANGGKISDETLRQIGRAGARNTQFASTIEDLPFFARTAGGKAIYHLNKFSLQYGTYLKNEIYSEARRGNMKPLIGLAVFAGLSDQTIGKLLELVSAKDYDATAEIMQDALLGKAASIANDPRGSRGGVVSSLLLGPAIGLVDDAFTGAQQLREGKFPTRWTPAVVRQTGNLVNRIAGQ